MDDTLKYSYYINLLKTEMKNLAYDDVFLKIRNPNERSKYIDDVLKDCEEKSSSFAKKLEYK